MHPRSATNVRVNMYYVMHLTSKSQHRQEEGQRIEYALFDKTGPSGFINQLLRFF
jgi:hypothetical protein